MWAAVVLGIFFRTWNLETKVYSDDEVHTSLWISGHTKSELREAFADREIAVAEVRTFQHIDRTRGLLQTIRVLAEGDPQHPPLYYLLVRLWAQFFGDSMWVIRSFSVLASLLVLPCVYWLCSRLFERRDVAQLATALVALSPFHVLYAQEAREYSLWTVSILLSSIAVWRASKEQTGTAWVLYCATVVFGLYTHTLFFLVMLAHVVFMAAQLRQQHRFKESSVVMCGLGYVAATVVGLIAFVPWLGVVAENLSQENFAASSWGSTAVEPWRLVAMWGFNLSTVFLDADQSLKFMETLSFGAVLAYLAQILILVVVGYALYCLVSAAPQAQRLFLLSIIVVPAVVLALPDVILGGIRSGGGNRYFIPSYLGIEIAVAHMLVAQDAKEDSRRPYARSAVGSALLAGGLISCILVSGAETWWIKASSYYSPRISRTINGTQRPLLVMAASPLLLVLSHRLDDKVRLWIVREPRALRLREGFSDVFLYEPSEPLLTALTKSGRSVRAVDLPGKLYHLSGCP